MDLFESVIGPESFTLAHELGHWVYDAVSPDQMELFAPESERVLCRSPGASSIHESERIREINANGFAAALLLPEDLLRSALTDPIVDREHMVDMAGRFGVSITALTIRLRELGMNWVLP